MNAFLHFKNQQDAEACITQEHGQKILDRNTITDCLQHNKMGTRWSHCQATSVTLMSHLYQQLPELFLYKDFIFLTKEIICLIKYVTHVLEREKKLVHFKSTFVNTRTPDEQTKDVTLVSSKHAETSYAYVKRNQGWNCLTGSINWNCTVYASWF